MLSAAVKMQRRVAARWPIVGAGWLAWAPDDRPSGRVTRGNAAEEPAEGTAVQQQPCCEEKTRVVLGDAHLRSRVDRA